MTTKVMTDEVELDTHRVPSCEGDPGCSAPVAVIFLGTGSKMCVEHAIDELNYELLKSREDKDTDKAPPDGSPTLPPISEIAKIGSRED
jgi:hypothetical protein